MIVVLADDLGIERLGCYGGPAGATPHLDRLASKGIQFRHCYSSPVCTPSRVQLLTGLYPFRTGWTSLISERPRDEQVLDPTWRTFGHMVSDLGYATALGGKWQLCHFEENPRHVSDCGFQSSLAWAWQVQNHQTPRYWAPVLWRGDGAEYHQLNEYGPDLILKFLTDFMVSHQSEPFLAFYPMLLPHEPWFATPETYVDGENRFERSPFKGKAYADMVRYMDGQIGKLMASLEREGLAENTIILFTSDNGTPGSVRGTAPQAGGSGGKFSLTQAGTHVPLIVSGGGVVPGQCDALVDLSDLAPTLVELAGGTAPSGIDGQSFAPRLYGKRAGLRDWVYSQIGENRWVFDRRFKMYGDGRLFDIQLDSEELSPIGRKEETRASAASRHTLQAALDGLI